MLNTPAILIAGAPGIDFLNSIATPVDERIDWIRDGAGFLDWLRQAMLAPPEVLTAIKSGAPVRDLDRVAAQARDLRAWFRTFVESHRGRPIVGKDLRELGPLNRLLERDESFARITSDGTTAKLHIERARPWRSAESLLIPVAEAIAQTIVEEDFRKIKACEGAACTLLFIDRTRAEGRRWCSMEVCGNRAKVSAHRNRSRKSLQRKSLHKP
jgi:predicted RNA-binding Zn ribbon-like protein